MTEMRTATEKNLPEVIDLTNLVFRGREGQAPTMSSEFPVLFSPENAGNLQIAVEEGRVVGHVGVARQTIITGGCRLPVCSIGAVATHPDFRGKGLATQLMTRTVAAAREAGDVLMTISGVRGIYKRMGSVSINAALTTTCDAEAVAALHKPDADWQVLRFSPTDHMQAVARLHEREAVRYAWPTEATQRVIDGFIATGCGGLIAVNAGGELQGWIFYRFAGAMHAGGPGYIRVIDMCGDRRAVGHLFACLPDFHELTTLEIRGTLSDKALIDRLTAANIAFKPYMICGMLFVLNAQRLFDLCADLLAERLTAEDLAALSVTDDGESVTFRFGEQQWEVEDRALLGRICLDPRRDWIDQCPRGAHQVADVLLAATPLDLPNYGVCFV